MFDYQFIIPFILSFWLLSCTQNSQVGQTEITKWQYDKKGAISITYDDGYSTQFTNAMIIMDRLGLPGTFFIVTGAMDGSEYRPQFKGRPVEDIIQESETIPTNEDNFFERASAINYIGYKEAFEYHRQAGSLFESGNIEKAYKVIDEAYAKVRNGELESGENITPETAGTADNTWEEFKEYTKQGHEFGSHTITHPRLAVLDKENLVYEIEKSREDVRNKLGPEHTFSVEGPFGTDDERVMEYLTDVYPATRNIMPHSWLEEIHRGNDTQPGISDKEYVQWQRGPLSDTSIELMKSWVDTTLAHDNIWLPLVFHGVDGIGWEPIPSEKLEEYFMYMKERENDLWIATFGDVTKYIRERMNTEVNSTFEEGKISISLELTMDPDQYLEVDRYDKALTLKTFVPADWNAVIFQQGNKKEHLEVREGDSGRFVRYQAVPGDKPVELVAEDI